MKAAELGVDPYELINDQIATSPIGANGVTFLSYLQGAGGARINGNARGTFCGMTLSTNKADMARAVMEGICYDMYDIIRAEEAAGVVRILKEYTPNPDNFEAYDAAYKKACDLYDALDKKIF